MLIGGLWHGASWTFVVWGALHGLYLAGERVAKRVAGDAAFWTTRTGRLLLGLVTFVLVCLAWVFFRATSFDQAFRIVGAMAGAGQGVAHGAYLAALIPIALLIAAHWAMRDTTLESVVARTSVPLRVTALSAMLLSLVLFPGVDRAFIYFQF
jgi:alginate O-acetyltransferase complex protein AlgI